MPFEVSIIIPCYNEQATVQLLLDALYGQSYPRSHLEVIIADGMSTDNTREVIRRWVEEHPDLTVRVVDNPRKIIPAALNTAIGASQGEVLIRLDAHSRPDPDYVALSVAALDAEKAENVGGVWDIQPGRDHWMARSIAAAAGHPIGVGDARYRFTDRAGYVDTVPFGAFHRTLLDRIGGFDETLLTNEDYEFNTRIRQSGGRVWLDPAIRSVYFARPDLKSLARQYWRYGYWKVQMLRRYPDSIRWRQAIPPVFVLGLALLALMAPWWGLAAGFLLGVIGIYSLSLGMAGLQLAVRHRAPAFLIGVPLAIACMHFSWGSGFLWGLAHPPKI
jgi:glycosyltransferase involved in cell wall biosynthesis